MTTDNDAIAAAAGEVRTDEPDCCWKCRAHYWLNEASKELAKVIAARKERLQLKVDLGKLKRENEELRAALSQPQFSQALQEYQPGTWFKAQTVDEMQAFYMARLPAIREAAEHLGYAIGLHGSCRRDFDLIAMPWRDDPADKTELAIAIQHAACGISYENIPPELWEKKPAGRWAISLPICWTEWHYMVSAGHIDLSVVAPPPTEGESP